MNAQLAKPIPQDLVYSEMGIDQRQNAWLKMRRFSGVF